MHFKKDVFLFLRARKKVFQFFHSFFAHALCPNVSFFFLKGDSANYREEPSYQILFFYKYTKSREGFLYFKSTSFLLSFLFPLHINGEENL